MSDSFDDIEGQGKYARSAVGGAARLRDRSAGAPRTAPRVIAGLPVSGSLADDQTLWPPRRRIVRQNQ